MIFFILFNFILMLFSFFFYNGENSNLKILFKKFDLKSIHILITIENLKGCFLRIWDRLTLKTSCI
jgi:predicted membrane channel-forming protein YqfA (hemolysin III family)